MQGSFVYPDIWGTDFISCQLKYVVDVNVALLVILEAHDELNAMIADSYISPFSVQLDLLITVQLSVFSLEISEQVHCVERDQEER